MSKGMKGTRGEGGNGEVARGIGGTEMQKGLREEGKGRET